MTAKNILIAGAAMVALIYWLSSQKAKPAAQLQSTQYGGYASHPSDDFAASEGGVYRV